MKHAFSSLIRHMRHLLAYVISTLVEGIRLSHQLRSQRNHSSVKTENLHADDKEVKHGKKK